MIRILVLIIFCSLALGCSPKKQTYINEAKNIIDTMAEPFAAIIPDSLKLWIPIFSEIGIRDQKFRSINNPNFLQQNAEQQKELDRINVGLVDSFLNIYGYPTMKQVGVKGMRAIRLVMQHGQREKQLNYYSILKKAFLDKKISTETLMLYEDRLNVLLKRRQYYGSQIVSVNKEYLLYPVVNFDSIDIYRKLLGSSLSFDQYTSQFFHTSISKSIYLDNEKWLIKKYDVNDSTSIRFIF